MFFLLLLCPVNATCMLASLHQLKARNPRHPKTLLSHEHNRLEETGLSNHAACTTASSRNTYSAAGCLLRSCYTQSSESPSLSTLFAVWSSWQDVSRLVDVCRQSIVYATLADLAAGLDAIARDPAVRLVRVKNRLSPTYSAAQSAGCHLRPVVLCAPEAILCCRCQCNIAYVLHMRSSRSCLAQMPL